MTKPIPGKTRPNPPISSPIVDTYDLFEQALQSGKKAMVLYRGDFISACMNHVDELRVREDPQEKIQGEVVQEKYLALKPVRDHLSKWVLLESQVTMHSELTDIVVDVLEQIGELKSMPDMLDGRNRWRNHWMEGHAIFVYETFLAIVAALLKSRKHKMLHEIYTSRYYQPSLAGQSLVKFAHFFGDSRMLRNVMEEQGGNLISPAAKLIANEADNPAITLAELQQADLLSCIMASISDNLRWVPQTLNYVQSLPFFPLFGRAQERKGFEKLAEITGGKSADDLRTTVQNKLQGMSDHSSRELIYKVTNFANLEKLDTLQ